MKRFLPWIILGVAVAFIAPNWLSPKTPKGDFELSMFGEIPVLVGGRMKPTGQVIRPRRARFPPCAGRKGCALPSGDLRQRDLRGHYCLD